MCSSLKGLVTDTADVTAVLAVSLSTVASQRVGILAHLVTVETLVPILSFCLVVLSTFMAFVSDLGHTKRFVGNIKSYLQKLIDKMSENHKYRQL